MADWVQLTKEQAKKHKLYGVGGWLIVFYIFFALNLLPGIGHANNAVYQYYRGTPSEVGYNPFAFVTSSEQVFGLQILGWIQFALYLSVFILAVSKNHNFRRVSTVLFVAFVIIKPVTLAVTMNFADFLMFPFYLLFIGVTLLYINLSKRVRVTFDWTVKSTDSFLTSEPDESFKSSVNPTPHLHERKEPTF